MIKILNEETPSDTIQIITNCPTCKKPAYVDVEFDDFVKWQSGELVQDAFPYLDEDERESLITGTCPACWEKLFGVNADEEE